MKTKKLLFYMLAVLLGGCVPVMSLRALYTEKDVTFDEKLLGTWVQEDNETTWVFTRAEEPKNAYKLMFSDEEGKKGSFIAHLVKLQNRFFLDVYPGKMPWGDEEPETMDWPYNSVFLIPGHTFLKIDSIEPKLKMAWIAEDTLKELLKENPNAVKHMLIEDRHVLTASTKQLQAFHPGSQEKRIAKYPRLESL
ncbi:MAG: hypothetical protein ACYTFW_17750 [Planctomycetota bacterium]|jgi:hypothetical protein